MPQGPLPASPFSYGWVVNRVVEPMTIRRAREGDCLPRGSIVSDECERCGRLGEILVESEDGTDRAVECPACQGWGRRNHAATT